MENYIVINGKRAELTAEQLKQLGIEIQAPKGNPFKRADEGERYYCINGQGEVGNMIEWYSPFDAKHCSVANYCTDKTIMEQRALHETLSRLLWRYSMEHDGDKINWEDNIEAKYVIYYKYCDNRLHIAPSWYCNNFGSTYFHKEQTAENAIKEIIEPFMKSHPNFKW